MHAFPKALARLAAALTISATMLPYTGLVHAEVTPSPASAPIWLRIDPSDPRILYVGGPQQCPDSGCLVSAARSTDAGTSWVPVDQNLTTKMQCPTTLDPVLIAADSSALYTEVGNDCGSPSTEYSQAFRSTDQGTSWQGIGNPKNDFYPYFDLTLVPSDPRRIYALYQHGDYLDLGAGAVQLVYSTDAGSHWHYGGEPGAALQGQNYLYSLVADPLRSTIVYANISVFEGSGSTVARSEDSGLTWTAVAAPSAGLTSFTVSTDPHEPGLLVGQSTDSGVPGDRLYLSADQGRTWRTATCPGDLQGRCPNSTLDRVFGAGASYAVQPTGIYRFSGSGPATARLPLSDWLPVPTDQIVDLRSGTHAGDPVYLLGRNTGDSQTAFLYRSLDAGQTWQLVTAPGLSRPQTPNRQPPSTAPGSLFVSATRHSVAPAFVSTYRRLGLVVIGFPITEAYHQSGMLVQDFERLRLELSGGQVSVGPLGRILCARSCPTTALRPEPAPAVGATAVYVPTTRHSTSGAFLRFWLQHGGAAVFGAPISRVFQAANGDGSGRIYLMQYFENARLELHPEAHDPRYAVQVGLLGRTLLLARGWAGA